MTALAALFTGDTVVDVIMASAPIDALITRVRAGRIKTGRIKAGAGRFVLIVAVPDLSPIDRAMLLAAITPLAVELGPERRIAALDVAAGAAEADIAAAAGFLAGAESTTGQVLAVT